MIDHETISERLQRFRKPMDTITRARSPLEIEWFVVGRYDNPMQQYRQAAIELDSKNEAVEEAIHNLKMREIEKERFQRKIASSTDDLDIREYNLEIQRIEREVQKAKVLMVGALKEMQDFMDIMETRFPDFMKMTEEEILAGEREYWISRFAKQISVDAVSSGHISAGNLSSLLSMDKQTQESVLLLAMQQTNQFKQLDTHIAGLLTAE